LRSQNPSNVQSLTGASWASKKTYEQIKGEVFKNMEDQGELFESQFSEMGRTMKTLNLGNNQMKKNMSKELNTFENKMTPRKTEEKNIFDQFENKYGDTQTEEGNVTGMSFNSRASLNKKQFKISKGNVGRSMGRVSQEGFGQNSNNTSNMMIKDLANVPAEGFTRKNSSLKNIKTLQKSQSQVNDLN